MMSFLRRTFFFTFPRKRGEVGSRQLIRVRGLFALPRLEERPLTPTLSPQAGRGSALE
jgi:hypothetical protein